MTASLSEYPRPVITIFPNYRIGQKERRQALELQTYSSKTATRNALQETVCTEHPDLRVEKSLSSLIRLVSSILNTSVVLNDLLKLSASAY